MAEAELQIVDPHDADWATHRKELITRLRRVEGQLRGIQSMIEREDDCETVAQQMTAARKALDRTFYHMLSCVMQRELACAYLDSADPRDRLKYATDLLARYG
ncbi:MAG: metal-sensing transcriptional repressor [Salinisphaera sp.]|nr:metal-sensing transcriptional repressor [Salinisphaera sp.]